MAIKSGFFNSINGDRVYNADDLNHFFEGIVSDGIFKGYKMELQVTAGSGMTIRVLTGKAIVLDKYVENNAALNLTIEGGNALPRYDAVVVGVDLTARTGTIYVKQGTAASTPTPPTMTNNTNSKEICLAYVYVSANATTITSDNITDKRADITVCGWVKLTNVAASLMSYRNNVTIQTATNAVPLGITEYDANHDTVLIYKNGFFLEEATDYLIKGTGSAAVVELSSTAPIGNKFDFVVLHAGL